MSTTPLRMLGSPLASAGLSVGSSSPIQVSSTLSWLSLHCSSGDSAAAEAAPNGDPSPSAHLTTVMNAHRPDCTEVIRKMVGKLADKLAPPQEHTRLQALRLYWLVLENMIQIETARLTRQAAAAAAAAGASHTSLPAAAATSSSSASPVVPPFRFESWLFSKQFHASLLAVAFEVVFFAQGDTPKLFPHAIDALDLPAFDFVKNLELCVRALPATIPTGGASHAPAALKQHLKRLENECLQWTAWKKGSPLLKLLQEQQQLDAKANAMQVDESPPSAAAAATTAKEEEKNVDATMAPAHPPPPSSVSPPPPPPTTLSVGMGYASAALSSKESRLAHSKQFELFSRQLFTLAAEHLSWLCSPSALNISHLHLEACWELLLEILTCHTHLLFERHLDTIILCVLYNILVKIAVPSTAPTSTLVGQAPVAPLDFKRIIGVYLSRWDQNQTKVVKEISSYRAGLGGTPAHAPAEGGGGGGDIDDEKEERMNIIAFYNKYFIHEIKLYSLDHIKPKLVKALEAQEQLRTTGASAVRLAAAAPPAGSTMTFAPSTPARTPGKFLPHRAHPYSVTAQSHLSLSVGATTPGFTHGLASIQTFLSPRKLHIPETNIYLSRIAASATAGQRVAQRVALGGSNALPASAASVGRTPTKLAPPARTDEAVASLLSGALGNSPAKSVGSTSSSRPPVSSAPPVHFGSSAAASVPLTPMTHSLYAFGESSPRGKGLEEVNKRLNALAQHQAQAATYASPTPNSRQAPTGSGSHSTPGSGRKGRALFGVLPRSHPHPPFFH